MNTFHEFGALFRTSICNPRISTILAFQGWLVLRSHDSASTSVYDPSFQLSRSITLTLPFVFQHPILANMPSSLPTLEEPPFLDWPLIQNPEHATCREFLSACQYNNTALALQLASDQEPAALTFGLNRALDCLHLQTARQLLLNGVQWDAQTVMSASNSFSAIKLLFDFGFNVNTGVLGGDTLLR